MSQRLTLTVATLAAFGLAPAAAHAETVLTVNVPLEFHALHEQVEYVRVACFAKGKDPITGQMRDLVSGFQHVDVKPDAKGDFVGTVKVTWDRNYFYTKPGDLQMLTNGSLSVSCDYSLYANKSFYVPNPKAGEGKVQSTSPVVMAKPGTKFVGSTAAK